MQQIPESDEKLLKIAAPAQIGGAADARPEAVAPARELATLLSRAGALGACWSNPPKTIDIFAPS